MVLFGYLAYLDSLWYLLVMLVGWLILDYFSVYVPLSPLRTPGLKNGKRISEGESGAAVQKTVDPSQEI